MLSIVMTSIMTVYMVHGGYIPCTGKDGCSGDTKTCLSSESCCVDCDGSAACSDDATEIIGNGATDMVVRCEGEDACKGAKITGGNGALIIWCVGKSACSSDNAVFTKGDATSCTVKCYGEDACKEPTLSGCVIERLTVEPTVPECGDTVTSAPATTGSTTTTDTTTTTAGTTTTTGTTATTTTTTTSATSAGARGGGGAGGNGGGDSSDSSSDENFFSALFSGSNGDDADIASNDDPKSYTLELNLSEMSLINLWGLVAAFLLLNGILYLCFYRKKENKEVSFTASDV